MKIFNFSAKPAGKGLLAALSPAIVALALVSCAAGGDEFARYHKDLPFRMGRVSRPQIPDNHVSIVDFGGVADGVTDNTEAFAAAIGHLSAMGGGHLNVPEGTWYTGPVSLKSHIDLHVQEGAVVVFSTDKSAYPIINTVFEGLDTKRCESPVNADGCTDIAITGGGVLDGSGDVWRALKKSKAPEEVWRDRLSRGGFVSPDGKAWYPDEAYYNILQISEMNVPHLSTDEEWEAARSFLRPVMISLRNCENVLLEDCTFRNSPCWNIHPLMCKNVIINNITVQNPDYAQNGDGIDIDSCEDVLLINSRFDVGDDAICIKSGKDADGRRRARPCRGLIVSGCWVGHGHGGFVVGSEMSGGVSCMKVSDCDFEGTDVGLRFKSKRGRGGVVDSIYIDNIRMKDIVTETLLFDLHYGGKSAVEALEDGAPKVEPMPVDEGTPAFRDIHISNVSCDGAGRAMYFNGLPEMPVKGIDIRDCRISSRRGIEIFYAEDVTLNNVKVTASEGEPLVTGQVSGINVK